MSDAQKISVRVSYEDQNAFLKHGGLVRKLIEKDTKAPPVETRSLPPMMKPQKLSQSTIDELKDIEGVQVRETD